MGTEYCQVAKPIIFNSSADVRATPESIQRQVLTHNNTGAQICGWGK